MAPKASRKFFGPPPDNHHHQLPSRPIPHDFDGGGAVRPHQIGFWGRSLRPPPNVRPLRPPPSTPLGTDLRNRGEKGGVPPLFENIGGSPQPKIIGRAIIKKYVKISSA